MILDLGLYKEGRRFGFLEFMYFGQIILFNSKFFIWNLTRQPNIL